MITQKLTLRGLAVLFLFIFSCIQAHEKHATSNEQPIAVIIPSYNNAKWARKNLSSLFSQEYNNYRVIYIDDCSSDNTAKIVKNYVAKSQQNHRFVLIENKERCGALENLYNAIHSCHDEEIIVTYDGDDWFPHEHVLERINEAYNSANVWLTYGTFIGSIHRKTTGHSKPFSADVVENNLFRTQTHPSHLRTFYCWLFKKIHKEDLLWKGQFYPMAWDLAMMFPMIEMAGERHELISDVTYIYNQQNPISDSKVDGKLQQELDEHIRNRPRYKRLNDKTEKPLYEESDRPI